MIKYQFWPLNTIFFYWENFRSVPSKSIIRFFDRRTVLSIKKKSNFKKNMSIHDLLHISDKTKIQIP